MVSKRLAGAYLTIDLDALAANWRTLADRVAPAQCAAVMKADAYGIGARKAGPVLAAAGCRTFFVAHAGEAIALRRVLPTEAEIFVLNGIPRGTETELYDRRLFPVLNSLEDIAAWSAAAGTGRAWPGAIQVNTGMVRLGLDEEHVIALAGRPDLLQGVDVRFWMSHLACAEDRDDPMNRMQLECFTRYRALLPAASASLANSSGTFLGPDFHFDLVRPGIALYGGNPTPGRPNPMREVVRLAGRILQIHRVDSPMAVGYGAAHKIEGPGRIAVVPVGYADGYLRALGGRARGYIDGTEVPVVGRVSMDLITLDVSALPPERCSPGTLVELIGGQAEIDDVAARAGTISYEILTSLGDRYHRVYRGGR